MAPIFVPGPEYDWHFWRLREDLNIRLEQINEGRNEDNEQKTDDGKRPSYFQLVARPYGWTEDFVLQDRLLMRTGTGDDRIYLRAVGRRDDLIVLATGEKVLPRILERMLEESPHVKTAVAFGEGQFELGVIVEPSTNHEDINELKKCIWPIILEAGKQMDSHAKISSPDGIIVATDEQKIARSDKGSISRKEIYRQFDKQIRRAYQLMENNTANGNSHIPLSSENLEEVLQKIVDAELADNLGSNSCGVDDDLFELGVNSLQCVRIYRSVQIMARLAAEKGDLSLKTPSKDFVHKNPTIARMAAALRLGEARNGTHQHTIEDYVARYGLPTESETTEHIILLTGSTGSLGSHLLAHLVRLPQVAKVICLRRKGAQHQTNGTDLELEGPKEQLKQATSKGASIPLVYQDKVMVIQVQQSKSHFGLPDSTYASLCSSVTHIVHAAWPMDFKRTLASFETQFAFLHNLLRLARDAHTMRPWLKPRLAFISSISVVGQYYHCHDGARIVPEEIMDGNESTNSFGYAHAKLVCENILSRVAASRKDEMEVCCIRLGQIAGASTGGFWNTKEHVPALISIAQRMGKWPKLKGVRIFKSPTLLETKATDNIK